MSAISALAKKYQKKFWCPPSDSNPFLRLTRQGQHSLWLAQAFYICNLLIWILYIPRWATFKWMVVIHPVWPLFWINTGSIDVIAKSFFVFNLATATIAAFWPERRTARVLAFLGVFFFSGLLASDAASWEILSHAPNYTLIAFLFMFLPSAKERSRVRNYRATYLATLAQIAILMSYFSSGVWRVREAIDDVMSGHVSMLGPDGLYISIKGLNDLVHFMGPMGGFFTSHRWLTAPVMPIVTLFELSALYVCLRPRLYRPFGILLLFFNLGFTLSVNGSFDEQILLVLIFLVPGAVFGRSA